MGGYVPPHLRNKAAQGDADSAAPPRSSSYNDLQGRGGSSRGGWGDDRGGSGGGGSSFGRRPDNRGSGNSSSRNTTVDPLFVPYNPSERVKALNEAQIADIRQRLNVTVEVPDGEPEAAAPVESFKDMVGHAMSHYMYHYVCGHAEGIGLGGKRTLLALEIFLARTSSMHHLIWRLASAAQELIIFIVTMPLLHVVGVCLNACIAVVGVVPAATASCGQQCRQRQQQQQQQWCQQQRQQLSGMSCVNGVMGISTSCVRRC